MLRTILRHPDDISSVVSATLRNLAFLVILSIVLMIVAPSIAEFLEDSHLDIRLRYWRAYPWLPAVIVSVCIASILAATKLSQWLSEKAKALSERKNLPTPICFLLEFLPMIDAKLFPSPAWWSLFIGSLVGLGILWYFPQCVTANDILVSFKISKGDAPIAILSPGESVKIGPGITVWLQPEIKSVSPNIDLPRLECRWMDTGIPNLGHLLHTTGCTVDYRSGSSQTSDPVSIRLTQSGCPALPPYSFFVDRKP